MRCSKCGKECEVMYGKSIGNNQRRAISVCCSSEIVKSPFPKTWSISKKAEQVIKEKTEMNDWKELEIGDLTTFPKDFFTNERIELNTPFYDKNMNYNRNRLDQRVNVIIDIREGIEYFYRLKPLKSIRITRKFMEILRHVTYTTPVQEIWKGKELIEIDNRKVEIIGDDE